MDVPDDVVSAAHWHASNGRGREAADLLAPYVPASPPPPPPPPPQESVVESTDGA